MLKNWIKIFVYHLKQNKLFSFLNTLGLAIGIGGIIFAVLYWNDEHAYNTENPNKNHLFQVVNEVGGDMKWPYTMEPAGRMLKAESPQLESYCYMQPSYRKDVIRYNGKKQLIEKIMDSQMLFFEYFPFKFVEGTAASALADEKSIAMEQKAARRVFGDESPIGKQVTMSNKVYVVRGVYRIDEKSSMMPEVVTRAIETQLADNRDQWGNFNFNLMLKLKDPADKDAVAKTLEDIYVRHRSAPFAKEEGMTLEAYLEKYGKNKVILEPLADARLRSQVDGYPEGQGNYKFLLIMAGLSVLILVLSIVNYVNLATASAIKRAKEVGVRKIVGASRGDIIRQFLVETVFTTLFAILLALAIVELALPYYNDFLGKNLEMHGMAFFSKLILIFSVVVVVAGIFPAMYVSNFETLKVLKGNFGRSKSGVWLRNGMLVMQFAIASFFIVGSYIVYQQVEHMMTKDLGFKGEQVLQIVYRNQYDWKEPNFRQKLLSRYQMTKQEVLKMPGVKAFSGAGFSFGNHANSSSGFKYNETSVQADNIPHDYDFIDMMGIKLLKGRNLSPMLASDTISSVILNETAVRLMKEKDPIGKKFKWNGYDFQVIGVVKDFHLSGPDQQIPPMVMMHYKPVDWMLGNTNHILVKADAATMDQTLAQLESFWTKNIDTEYPFTYDFVDKNFARTYKTFVNQRNLFALLNGVVILIALFGLFALASFSIERRMKEIAIRKTLGAETGSLLKELSRQYLLFCAVGFVIAFFPTRLFLSRWLEDFAYRIDISAMPFIIGFLLLCVLTLSVVIAKAYKATQVDVLKYLKYE